VVFNPLYKFRAMIMGVNPSDKYRLGQNNIPVELTLLAHVKH
jgi:hypothetical protein